MADWGIKVAKKGSDVTTAADKDLIFSSKYDTIKVFLKGTTSITTDGSGNGSITIAHNLGYAPTFFVWRKGTASWQKTNPGSPYDTTYPNAYFPNVNNQHAWIDNHLQTSAYTDSVNLTIKMTSAANSTTYNFVYFICVDLAQAYNLEAPIGDSNWGIKVSKPGVNVLDHKDFLLAFSSRYRSLKYDPTISGTTTLSLPLIFGSVISSPNPEEATYVDINHNLGYPPFFLAYYTTDDSSGFPSTSYATEIGLEHNPTNTFTDAKEVNSWCDATRIRITFWRRATATHTWPTNENITIKYLIFKEDLTNFT